MTLDASRGPQARRKDREIRAPRTTPPNRRACSSPPAHFATHSASRASHDRKWSALIILRYSTPFAGVSHDSRNACAGQKRACALQRARSARPWLDILLLISVASHRKTPSQRRKLVSPAHATFGAVTDAQTSNASSACASHSARSCFTRTRAQDNLVVLGCIGAEERHFEGGVRCSK